MFGNLGNIAEIMKTAKNLQGNMAKLQEELATRRHEGDAGGGMVRVTVDGKGTLIDVKINPEAAADVEMLEDLVKAAVGQAVTKSQEAMKAEMAQLTGGINLPGLTDMMGGAS